MKIIDSAGWQVKINKPLNKDPSKADTTFDVFLFLSYGFAEIEIIATKQLPFFFK